MRPIVLLFATMVFGSAQTSQSAFGIQYATYFGGPGSKTTCAVILDASGNVYLIGATTFYKSSRNC